VNDGVVRGGERVKNVGGRGRGEPGFSDCQNVNGFIEKKVSKKSRFVQGRGDRGSRPGVKVSEVESRVGARIKVNISTEK